MENYLLSDLISKVELFSEFSNDDLKTFLDLFSYKIIFPSNGESINVASTNKFGILLEGKACVYANNYDGEQLLIHPLGEYSTFAESIIFNVSISNELFIEFTGKCKVLLIGGGNYNQKIKELAKNYPNIMIALTKSICKKIEKLKSKINAISRPSLRDKILAYLEHELSEIDGDSITLSITKQELAKYLNSNRSALSREISNLVNEGLLEVKGNNFKLLY